MALHSRIVNVLRKPGKCPVCGEAVWDIIFLMLCVYFSHPVQF